MAGWENKTIFLFIQPARAEILHTLSKNILFLQPARAEILFTPFQAIFLFFQPARAGLLHTLSNNIFYLQPDRAEILSTPFWNVILKKSPNVVDPNQSCQCKIFCPGSFNWGQTHLGFSWNSPYFTPFQTLFYYPNQPRQSFPHPLKQYFIPPASQGRNTFLPWLAEGKNIVWGGVESSALAGWENKIMFEKVWRRVIFKKSPNVFDPNWICLDRKLCTGSFDWGQH